MVKWFCCLDAQAVRAAGPAEGEEPAHQPGGSQPGAPQVTTYLRKQHISGNYIPRNKEPPRFPLAKAI